MANFLFALGIVLTTLSFTFIFIRIVIWMIEDGHGWFGVAAMMIIGIVLMIIGYQMGLTPR